jgi:hypothetical protein
MTKKSFKQIRDIIYNNLRENSQYKGNDAKIEDDSKRMTLYDETIDEKRIDLMKRIVKGYNNNRKIIANKPEQPELTQSEKRKRKLADLLSRSNSWRGLESCNPYTRENE